MREKGSKVAKQNKITNMVDMIHLCIYYKCLSLYKLKNKCKKGRKTPVDGAAGGFADLA